jgi:hypothetical protein
LVLLTSEELQLWEITVRIPATAVAVTAVCCIKEVLVADPTLTNFSWWVYAEAILVAELSFSAVQEVLLWVIAVRIIATAVAVAAIACCKVGVFAGPLVARQQGSVSADSGLFAELVLFASKEVLLRVIAVRVPAAAVAVAAVACAKEVLVTYPAFADHGDRISADP